jgi:hypothetical protein
MVAYNGIMVISALVVQKLRGWREDTDTQDDYLITLFCPLLKQGKYTENNLWL